MVVLWGFDVADPLCFLKPMVCACLKRLEALCRLSWSDNRAGSTACTAVIREFSRDGQSRAAVDPSLVGRRFTV